MPYCCIETNIPTGDPNRQGLLKDTSAFIAEMLDKPESFVMVSIKQERSLIFGGNDLPAAFVTLKSIGLPQDRCGDFSEKICRFIETQLGVAKERVFIQFKNLERDLFGWNGKTF